MTVCRQNKDAAHTLPMHGFQQLGLKPVCSAKKLYRPSNDAKRRVYGKDLAKKAEMFCSLFCSIQFSLH